MLARVFTVGSIVVWGATAGCAGGGEELDGYADASIHEGGRLYDRIWADSPPVSFVPDHPLWRERPDKEASAARGAETWRCKECHGWDYLGVDGEYGEGEHRTGFPGILNVSRAPGEVYELLALGPGDIEGGHGYGEVLEERELWDLVRFVDEGARATVDIIDSGGQFAGNVSRGEELFLTGIGTEAACGACHGPDGVEMPHIDDGHEGSGAAEEENAGEAHDETVGGVARESPWEFHHKARFGHPGSAMHGYQFGGATHAELGALGAFAQTLP